MRDFVIALAAFLMGILTATYGIIEGTVRIDNFKCERMTLDERETKSLQ